MTTPSPSPARSTSCEGWRRRCPRVRTLRRDPAAGGHASVIDAQLDRLRAGMEDLEAARRGSASSDDATDAAGRARSLSSFLPWSVRRRSHEAGDGLRVGGTSSHHRTGPPPFRQGARQRARQCGRARLRRHPRDRAGARRRCAPAGHEPGEGARDRLRGGGGAEAGRSASRSSTTPRSRRWICRRRDRPGGGAAAADLGRAGERRPGGLAGPRARGERATRELGPSLGVLVAARDLPAGARITGGSLAVRHVPARFAPPDALTSGADVVGVRIAVPVGAGAYLSAGMFAGAGRRDHYGLRPGERAVTVEVAGGLADAGPASGSRVDVLVSTDSPGGGRTQMTLAGAELLGVGEAAAGYSDPGLLRDIRRPHGPRHASRHRPPGDIPHGEPTTSPARSASSHGLPGDRSRAGAVVAQAQL